MATEAVRYPHCKHCQDADELLGGEDMCQQVMEDHGFPCLKCGQGEVKKNGKNQ